MTYEFIEYTISDGIGRVRLNRPQKLNALSRELQDEMVDCLQSLDDNPDVRVLTLMGNGRAFCAGYDITPPATPEEQAASQERRDNIRSDIHRMKQTPNTMAQVLNLSKPIIAGIHGYCIAGGTDLAMHCDISIAADDAQIGFPPVRSMGTPPTHMWTYMVGPQWAKWFLLTGESVSGKRARGNRPSLEVRPPRRPRSHRRRPRLHNGAHPLGASSRQQEHRQPRPRAYGTQHPPAHRRRDRRHRAPGAHRQGIRPPLRRRRPQVSPRVARRPLPRLPRQPLIPNFLPSADVPLSLRERARVRVKLTMTGVEQCAEVTP